MDKPDELLSHVSDAAASIKKHDQLRRTTRHLRTQVAKRTEVDGGVLGIFIVNCNRFVILGTFIVNCNRFVILGTFIVNCNRFVILGTFIVNCNRFIIAVK